MVVRERLVGFANRHTLLLIAKAIADHDQSTAERPIQSQQNRPAHLPIDRADHRKSAKIFGLSIGYDARGDPVPSTRTGKPVTQDQGDTPIR